MLSGLSRHSISRMSLRLSKSYGTRWQRWEPNSLGLSIEQRLLVVPEYEGPSACVGLHKSV
jgi:hypothetical protein